MNDTLKHWNQKAWAIADQLPGGIANDLHKQWNELASKDKVVVTLFGPYGTGKSSLLKRLHVENAITVPDWLIIGGGRTTFEKGDAEMFGLIIRDTPGVAGGNEVHEAVTDEALLSTDVVVVMLPPQLITGDAKAAAAITSVLDGSRFHCASSQAFAPAGLFIVLSRMDEAGAMPDVDLAGYESLVKRKRVELISLLARAKVDEARLPIHAVVPDWSGMVSNASNATVADYDGSRAWDGVAALAASLRALAQRRDELRIWSERRFLRSHLGSMLQSLELTLSESTLACTSAANEIESLALQLARLNALLGDARANLNHRVAEEVQSVFQRGGSTPEAVKELLKNRIDSSLERWRKAQDAAVQSLADDIDAEVEQRHSRPDWKAMVDALDDESIPGHAKQSSAAPARAGSKRDDILRVNQKLKSAYLELAPTVLDMPLDRAREELKRLNQAGSFQEYAKQAARRSGTLRDAGHVERAKTMVQIEWALVAAVPAAIEIAGLVGELQADTKAAEERIAKRDALRATVDKAADELSEKTWQQWHDEGLPAALATALNEARSSAEARSKLLKHQHLCAEELRNGVQAIMNV